jgi:NADH dehydrogenase
VTVPTVAITGASGFIGSRIARRFVERGWRVLALVRDPSRSPGVPYDLAGPVPTLDGVDWLVHAAYVPGEELVNVEGSRRLVEALPPGGRSLFISSVAAQPGTTSHYGRQKLACEPLFDAALRPGLVLGDGGLVRRTANVMRRMRMVPLVAGGRQPLQTIAVDDVVTAVERVVDRGLVGVYTVADARPTTYRDVYRAIAAALGLRVLFVPVPYGALELALRSAAVARIDLGVGTDNLRGLRSARFIDTTADLERLGLRPEPMEAALRRTLSSGAS